LNQISQEVFSTFEKDHPDLYPLAWLAAQNKILDMLKRFIPQDLADQKESGFVPKYFEIDLHEEMKLRGSEKLILQGRLDRLDVREGAHPAYRVVDYKTGLGGIKKGAVADRWETCVAMSEGALGFAVGRYFVNETFGGASKEEGTQVITGECPILSV